MLTAPASSAAAERMQKIQAGKLRALRRYLE